MIYRGLLLDLEGVLHQGDTPIPGAAEALSELQQRGLAIRYLTNTTTRPRSAIAERLQALGFAVKADTVFSPSAAAARLLADLGAGRIHLAAAPELAEDLAGFEILDAGNGRRCGGLGRSLQGFHLGQAERPVPDRGEGRPPRRPA